VLSERVEMAHFGTFWRVLARFGALFAASCALKADNGARLALPAIYSVFRDDSSVAREKK
jgi:hypothetical protein